MTSTNESPTNQAASNQAVSSKTIEVPELGLILLCGASGSGKSTFAHKNFADTEIVSGDQCRALVGDDETDQAVTKQAFALLHDIVEKRLELGRLTVVDATNINAEDRRPLRELARKWDVITTAFVFLLPLETCLEHNRIRTDRQIPEYAIKRQHRTLRRSHKKLRRERFKRIHTFESLEEIDRTSVVRSKVWNNRKDDGGPFDIIGDVHGCNHELEMLLAELGYDMSASPVAHPEGRRALFLGDLVDRGPGTPEVLELVMSMVEGGTALCILGNHENKLGRSLAGRNVKVSHGLAESLEQLESRGEAFRHQVAQFIDNLVSHYVLDEGRLVVAHAGLSERYHGRTSGRVRSLAMYGDTDGETDNYGFPVRYPWAEDYRGKASVVYGHTVVSDARWVNNTICLDTGCVFGGELTALRWPEKEVVSVPAAEEYYEPVRPVEDEGEQRPPQMLAVDDVTGKRHVETALAGRLTVDGERSSAALEVMSRFAVDPRWLVHLPPTMAPVATSERPNYLEHPDEAFAYFQNAGVRDVVCQEKHMGSRALLVIAKDLEVAQRRFGIAADEAGVITTRTGRSFFSEQETSLALLDNVRQAISDIDLWGQLQTDWLVMDAEILPWSAKAMALLKDQYAATGAAATTVLSAASDVLGAALARGVDVGGLAERTETREKDVEKYVDAYRNYCWDVDGTSGIEIAPFQLLAAEGEVLARRPHKWHMDIIDTLVAQAPETFRSTDRRSVNLDDQDEVDGAIQWWVERTNRGGEGMVVKPADPIVQGEKGLVLPGVKCRGPEYLRIIYGPEYLAPENLTRLKKRSLGRKRSLARREFALGIEALDRFVRNEHLFKVHECVFAVLALESEPVDPRL